ncbi:hypothetical protein ISS07_01055 [Candidatus Woesearchaeota archaeon]|nr:hypothetical protein [Candidatus Woesearchaeota archaeon]
MVHDGYVPERTKGLVPRDTGEVLTCVRDVGIEGITRGENFVVVVEPSDKFRPKDVTFSGIYVVTSESNWLDGSKSKRGLVITPGTLEDDNNFQYVGELDIDRANSSSKNKNPDDPRRLDHYLRG